MCRKLNVLLAFANPEHTARLKLGAENRDIAEAIRRGRCRDAISVRPIFAVTIDTFRRELLDRTYDIIHFSGHGTDDGLILGETANGQRAGWSGERLSKLFEPYAASLECVTLNACFSRDEADVIARKVPVAIGMNVDIFDDDGFRFAVGFFDALATGRDIDAAHDEGVRAVFLESPGSTFSSYKSIQPGSPREQQVVVSLRTEHVPDQTIRIRPGATVGRLRDAATCLAGVGDAASAVSRGVPIDWVLVDIAAADDWEQQIPFGDDVAVVVKAGDRVKVSRSGNETIQEMGIRNGTVFRIYGRQNRRQPTKPLTFDKF